MTITSSALLEIHSLTTEAERLSRGGASDRKKADALLARASGVRSCGISSDEARKIVANEAARQMGLPEVDYSEKAAEQRRAEHIFMEFLRGCGPKELRQLTAGSQTISWTEGPLGGYLVPESFADDVIYGFNLTTPLLSKDNVTLIINTNARPKPVPGIDLTQISGSIVTENTQQLPANPPTITSKTLQGYSFKSSPILASFEFETDSFKDMLQLLSISFSVGLARAMSPYLENGVGSTGTPPQPMGLYQALQAIGPSVTTASPTAITANEVLAIFHSVDKLHRNSAKAAWVMSDANWLLLKQTAASLGEADTSAWRFIMSDASDDILLGKKVLIDNSLPSGPSSPILFGALEHFIVRLTDLRVRRNQETGYISSYQALYTSLIRCDANLIAPGNDRPVQYGLFYS